MTTTSGIARIWCASSPINRATGHRREQDQLRRSGGPSGHDRSHQLLQGGSGPDLVERVEVLAVDGGEALVVDQGAEHLAIGEGGGPGPRRAPPGGGEPCRAPRY